MSSLQHTMTLFVAHDKINKVMRYMDLRPDYKWYVVLEQASFKTTSQVNEEYFQKFIQESKKLADENQFWIPAIKYMDNLFVDPDVKILSDGQKELFVQ